MMILRRDKFLKTSPLHVPVLLEEVMVYLNPKPNEHFIDATIGTGGHAEKILEKTSPNGLLYGFDFDSEALKIAERRLRRFKNRFFLFPSNFIEAQSIINEQSRISKFNGFLLDLGLSSFQLEARDRGFSFKNDGPLDMRFGQAASSLTASEILNSWSERDIRRILEDFGEERYHREIASAIVSKRKRKKFSRMKELVELVEFVYRNKPKPKKIHLATKVIQALRIAVNDELNNIRGVLPRALELLIPSGRLVVISFHSLEDRIVKQFFQLEAKDCLCPPEFPVCRCGHKKQIEILTKKVVSPSWEEIKQNYRSRSAKLRAAAKLP